MARRHRRYAALAEYGEPFGDVGILGDFFNVGDLKDFGIIAGSATLTAVVVPKLTKLIDNITFFGKATPYVKGAAGILAGFATYKYIGRKLPAKWHDAVVAASAVMAGLGVATIGHQLFDTGAVGAKLKGFHGLGNLFPVSLSNVGPDEDMLLAGLQAIENQTLQASFDPAFGGFVNDDEVPQFAPEMSWPPESDYQATFGDAYAEMDGLNAYENEMDGLDATIMDPDGWAYGEEQNLNALSLMQ
jgi:hypothetical protein